MARIVWAPIIERAAEIVDSYATGVTLRQLHYRLVSLPELGYPNTEQAYKGLSHHTADARRDGLFPPLVDLTRSITAVSSWKSPRRILEAAARQYRRDRTEGQDLTPLIIIEKATLATQMSEWFGAPLGIMIAPLRGYSSVSFDDEIRAALDRERSYRVLYVGDFDPSGEDIERHAEDEIAIPRWERVAILSEQIDEYGLPENPGKSTDSRAKKFAAKYGRLVQVEVEALDPDDLRTLVQEAIDAEWDMSAFDAVMKREGDERDRLEEFADSWQTS